MSVRLEWLTATDPYVRPELYEAGETLADGNRVTGPVALGIGPVIIEAQRASELEDLLRHGLALVRSEALAESYHRPIPTGGESRREYRARINGNAGKD